jgi:hypothetical protein
MMFPDFAAIPVPAARIAPNHRQAAPGLEMRLRGAAEAGAGRGAAAPSCGIPATTRAGPARVFHPPPPPDPP